MRLGSFRLSTILILSIYAIGMSVQCGSAYSAQEGFEFDRVPPVQRVRRALREGACVLAYSVFHRGFSRKRFLARVQAVAPRLADLTEEELSLIARAYELVREDLPILVMLQQFRGQRSQLATYFRNYLEFAEGIRTGRIQATDLLNRAGFEQIREIWNYYETRGWTLRTQFHGIGGTASARVHPDRRRIDLRVIPSDEPLELVLAEEVLHVEAIDLITENAQIVRSWARNRIGEIVGRSFLDAIDSHAFHDYTVTSMFNFHVLDQIPEPQIRAVVAFLIERDAFYQKLPLYAELVRTNPELRSQHWDQILLSSNPRQAITEFINQNRFRFPPALIAQLGEESLEDIVRTFGGRTISEIRRARPQVVADIPMPWRTIAELRAETPSVYSRIPRERWGFGDFNRETMLDPVGAAMSESEAAGLVRYLKSPHVSLDPDRTQQSFLRQLGSRPVPTEVRRDADFVANIQIGLYMLSAYDRKQGSSLAVDTGLSIISQLQRNPRAGSYTQIFSAVARLVENSTEPTAAARFFAALDVTPAIEGVVRDANFHFEMSSILQLTNGRNDPSSIPNPDHVFNLVRRFIDYREGMATGSRDYHQYNERVTALGYAQMGRDYFRTIGDTSRANALQADCERLQAAIDEHSRRPVDFRPRLR